MYRTIVYIANERHYGGPHMVRKKGGREKGS